MKMLSKVSQLRSTGIGVFNGHKPGLHQLADELGYETDTVRHALMTLCTGSLTRATQEDAANFEDAWGGSAFADNVVAVGKGATEAVYGDDSQEGMFWVSEDSPEGVPGFQYAISAEGADDDVALLCRVHGLQRDGKPYEKPIRGSGIFEFPRLAANTADVYVEFVNPTDGTNGTDVQVIMTAWCKRAGDDVATAGAAALYDRGISIGKSEDTQRGQLASAISDAFEGFANGGLMDAFDSVRSGGRVSGGLKKAVSNVKSAVAKSTQKRGKAASKVGKKVRGFLSNLRG